MSWQLSYAFTFILGLVKCENGEDKYHIPTLMIHIRGGRYLGYIIKPRYSDVTVPVSSKILGNDIIMTS